MPEIRQLGRNSRGIVHLFASLIQLSTNPCPCSNFRTNEAKSKRKINWGEKKKSYPPFFSSFRGGLHMRVGHERLRLIKYLPG